MRPHLAYCQVDLFSCGVDAVVLRLLGSSGRPLARSLQASVDIYGHGDFSDLDLERALPPSPAHNARFEVAFRPVDLFSAVGYVCLETGHSTCQNQGRVMFLQGVIPSSERDAPRHFFALAAQFYSVNSGDCLSLTVGGSSLAVEVSLRPSESWHGLSRRTL